jgi:hypothetical protein
MIFSTCFAISFNSDCNWPSRVSPNRRVSRRRNRIARGSQYSIFVRVREFPFHLGQPLHERGVTLSFGDWIRAVANLLWNHFKSAAGDRAENTIASYRSTISDFLRFTLGLEKILT